MEPHPARMSIMLAMLICQLTKLRKICPSQTPNPLVHSLDIPAIRHLATYFTYQSQHTVSFNKVSVIWYVVKDVIFALLLQAEVATYSNRQSRAESVLVEVCPGEIRSHGKWRWKWSIVCSGLLYLFTFDRKHDHGVQDWQGHKLETRSRLVQQLIVSEF